MHKNLVSFLFGVSVLASASAAQSEVVTFHPPRSEAEKRLDTIIHAAERDRAMPGALLRIPGYDDSLSDDYDAMFTPKLMASWAQTQAKLVQKDCNGEYRDDTICGVDGNPVTCSLETSEVGYLYRTVRQTPTTAVIAYSWPNQPVGAKMPTYRLIKSGTTWKLDGVDCGYELLFNMK